MKEKENKLLFVWIIMLITSIILQIVLMYEIGIVMSFLLGLVITLLAICMAKLEEIENGNNNFSTEKIIIGLMIIIIVIKIIRMNP